MADPTTLGEYIDQQAIRYNVPVDLVNSILDQESGGVHAKNGQITTSPQGAVGMFQLLPSTAHGEFKLDASDPFENVQAGIRYLRKGLDATNNDPIAAAAFYHGGPNLVQHGVKTRQYAADIDRRLRERLKVAANPTASNAAAGLPPNFTPPPPPPPSQPFQTTPRAKTAWERWTGTTTEIPPDVAASMGGNPATMQDQLWENTKKMGQAFDPREREGRRNLAATAVGVALTPVVLAGLASALGVASVGALIAMGTSAVLAGSAGSVEEWLEQMVEKHGIPGGLGGFDTSGVKPTRTELDYGDIAGAGGEQAAYDVGGHLILGGGRAVARHGLGPGLMRRAAEGFADERLLTLKTIQAAIDELKTGLRNFTFKTAEKGAAARAATQDATDILRAQKAEGVDVAKAQAEATLGGAKETGRRNIAAGEEQARTDVANAVGEGQVAQTQLGDQFNTAVGPPVSEPATGRAVIDTLEGPGQAAHDILGQAVDVEAARGGPINIQAIQAEARRLFAEEVLPPEQAFPRAAPVPGTPPPPPPAFSPKFRQAVSEAELQGAASHPAMPTIDRLLNAAGTVDSAELHAWYKRLASAIDWENPAAGTVEGARKRLVGMMREALGANNPSYDAAARAYEESYTRMKRGYAADIAKAAVEKPERAVQMIHPNDPTMTEHLMSTLRQHNPQVATAVSDSWLQRNILRGGLEGLGQRLRILREAPEFARSLLGPTHDATMDTLTGYASAWDDLVRESAAHTAATEAGTVVAGTSAAGPVTVGGRRGVEAAKQLAAQRVGDTRAAGTAAVDTARKTGQAAIDAEKKAFRGTARQRASDLRLGKLEYQEAVQAQRVKGRAAQEISEEEAIALSHASSAARTFVDAFRGIGFPKTPSGALGLFRMLMGPNSEQLLRVAAKRPEIGRHLVDWLADPNVRASYRIAKRFVGTEVGYHEAKPELEKYRQSQVGQPPPKPGDTDTLLAVSPPRR